MIRPEALATDEPHGPTSSRGCDIWSTIVAAETGDVAALRELLDRDASLVAAEYWYTTPLHFAVRSGHVEAVELLLEAGADPSAGGVLGEDFVVTARDRGYEDVAARLETARDRRGRVAPAGRPDHAIHVATDRGDVEEVRRLLDGDPTLLEHADRAGGTPLHRAVAAPSKPIVDLLLDRGANLHARHGAGPGSDRGYAAVDFQPIDLSLWTGPFWGTRGDDAMARHLIARGAEVDLVIASALGDLDDVQRRLDEHPEEISATRASGKRALSSAVEFGHGNVARLLLQRGADTTWSDGETAPRGTSLHAAARRGDLELVELLLGHGADPDSGIDSSGSAAYAASTEAVRRRLLDAGATLSVYDLIWLNEDAEALRRVEANPDEAAAGCGSAFAAACTTGKGELVEQMLAAGARVPSVVTGCRSYLLADPELLRRLLASGMDPNLPSWQRATPLHDLCGRDSRGRPIPERRAAAEVLIDAGADLAARDAEFRSTPLGWAARTGLLDMVELLLAKGAPPALEEDEAWSTPMAWAVRRGHDDIVRTLKSAGA